MKSLYDFAQTRGLEVREIKYFFQSKLLKRRGYDLVDPATNQIFASFEPKAYSNGDRWFLRHGTHRDDNDFCKRITPDYLSKLVWDEYPVRAK